MLVSVSYGYGVTVLYGSYDENQYLETGRRLDIPARKQDLTRSGRSIKVMHFGVNEKPTRDCTSLYNDAGLISKK